MKKQPADSIAATELSIAIRNCGETYSTKTDGIIKKLAAKVVKGKYDDDLAIKAFKHLADDGARNYAKMHDTGNGFGCFSPATREETARDLLSHYCGHIADIAADIIGPAQIGVSCFSHDHDGYGNPSAHYAVDGVTQTKRRVQSGYGSDRMDGARVAVENAGHVWGWYQMDESSIKGDRPGTISAVFNRRKITVNGFTK